ncbi:MAG: hypothetical protein DRJ03_02090 [Chloroflexi bacterium]|nr:MAG: hypothetical protein DRJ03_02090 [Chloroflexota bacterium]
MEKVTEWAPFTTCTNEPKLLWLEQQLKGRGIKYRRNGESSYAPILEVSRHLLDDAWAFFAQVDDIADDDTRWEREMQVMCSCVSPPPMYLESYPPKCGRCNKPVFLLVSGK